jgi:beta-galactosidase
MDWLLGRACGDAGVRPACVVPAGVEALRRVSATTTLLYLLNHGATAADIALDADADELLTGRRLSGMFTLEPQGVAILISELRMQN